MTSLQPINNLKYLGGVNTSSIHYFIKQHNLNVNNYHVIGNCETNSTCKIRLYNNTKLITTIQFNFSSISNDIIEIK